jgi:hypothetical protein
VWGEEEEVGQTSVDYTEFFRVGTPCEIVYGAFFICEPLIGLATFNADTFEGRTQSNSTIEIPRSAQQKQSSLSIITLIGLVDVRMGQEQDLSA